MATGTTNHHWIQAEVQEERFALLLPSGATVVFLVRARNEHGLSPPSLLSDRLGLDAGGGGGGNGAVYEDTEEDRGELRRRLAGRLLNWRPVEVVSPTEVILTWNVSKNDSLTRLGEGFRWYYWIDTRMKCVILRRHKT
jgi:hypothetical protein